MWAFQGGWCGLHLFYFIFIYLFSHCYIVLLWFLSHCPVHIDISKLKWILLFSTYHCVALGILSERTRDSLCCRRHCWGFRSVALSFCDIWSCCGCAGSTTRIVNYYCTVLSLMSTLYFKSTGHCDTDHN